MDIPIPWLWSRLKLNDLPITGCRMQSKTKQAKSFAPLSFDNYNLVRHCYLVLSPHDRWRSALTDTIATSLVPYKSLWWSLARFTPDGMPPEIRSPVALLTDVNVNTCFHHRFFNMTRRQSRIHSIQLFNTYLQESSFPFFLIVQHQKHFLSQQHKVICKLLLIGVCGSPFLLS